MSKNPATEFLYEKKAFTIPQGVKDFAGRAAGAAASGAATAVGAAAIGGSALAVSKIYDAATKGRDFKMMLEHNGEIAQAHAEDPKRINMYFTTLRTFNPEFSKDPLVAGTYIRQMMESPTHIGGQASNLVADRSKIKHPMMDMLMGAASKAKPEPMGRGGARPRPAAPTEHEYDD
jgi:hypothetical protein